MSQKNINVKIKKLVPEAVIPTYAHNGDVGMDLTAISMEYDKEHDMYIYHTGLAFESDFNYGQFLFPRSSNRKTDAYLCNHVGIADSAIYRGEIILCFKNRTSTIDLINQTHMGLISQLLTNKFNADTPSKTLDEVIENEFIVKTFLKARNEDLDHIEQVALEHAPYKVGDRIAQMVFLEYPTVELTEVEELSDTERGSGAFGSTGK